MSNVDVVLIRSQEHDYEYRQWHEDIRLGYLVRYLEDAHYTCRVFDYAMRPLLTSEAYDEAVCRIAEYHPTVVVFVMDKYPTNSPYYTSKMIRQCRSNPTLARAHFTVYENTTLGTEKLLHDLPIDSVAVGEEADFVKLIEAILAQKSLDDVPGVAYRQSSGMIKSNPPLPLADLASMPIPRHYYFDLPIDERHAYGYVGGIIASRGCYAKCTFCYIRAYEKAFGSYPWRGRQPQNVVDEIEQLYHVHGVREFAFLDPQFFGPGKRGQQWATEVAQEIISRGLNDIAFSIYVRANDIREESLSLLKQAGLYAVFIGIESFSQSVLDRFDKGLKVAENIRAIDLLMKYDIRLRMGFITFDHFTTMDELRESITQLKALCAKKPHLITQPIFFQNILTPLDDTPAGDHYTSIGAAQESVTYEYQQLVTERQKRVNRSGIISTFADARVAYLSEATRLLASEILQRTTYLENQLSHQLTANTQSSALIPQIDYGRSIEWFNNLTRFAIMQFDRLFTLVESQIPLDDELLDRITEIVIEACNEHDDTYLGYRLSPGLQVREALFD